MCVEVSGRKKVYQASLEEVPQSARWCMNLGRTPLFICYALLLLHLLKREQKVDKLADSFSLHEMHCRLTTTQLYWQGKSMRQRPLLSKKYDHEVRDITEYIEA
jgi:hypothetical protein